MIKLRLVRTGGPKDTRALSPLHGTKKKVNILIREGRLRIMNKAPKLCVQAGKWKEDMINAIGKALSVLQSMGVPGAALKPNWEPSKVYLTGGGDDGPC